MIGKIWKDPVWSKIIATGLLALFGAISTYFLDWWPSIKLVFVKGFNYLLNTSEIPNWLIGIMGVCTVITIIVLLLIVKEIFLPSSGNKTWKSYTCDKFFGLEWHWTFGSNGGEIYNLYSCCTRCQYQVFPQYASSYAAVDSISYKCDSCGSEVGPFSESNEEIESKVRRFIQQKLRTGKWDSETENA
ncbi:MULTISPECIES: hypothetical protein [Vibrio harveyi group]|uniref:hypothetical protein n=1 Tax=Vibrio harveyi group TaxID=717610 RepID=UPI0015F6AFB3|nr:MULTISPECIES: hypothetical protein [Vibrio harveyi group]MBE4056318.1 hypothetical protein [Vibrio parahaemolyticus]UJX30694.1 hypothetical protein JHS79_06600 [Vibrio parahaemolyticus]HCG9194178.1 hypothetical protein [Vibrio parahaemolyticus]HCH0835887.1 hypothetical protein [Vibrio parahaemolyticus]